MSSVSNLYAGANLLVSLDFVAHKMYVTNLDTNITTSSNINSSVDVTDGTMRIGIEAATNIGFKGSIDLKQFSITVDGKEVFSGNKTGLDVIKPDNYTVVGSPVISDDGVASGFSASNRLKIIAPSLILTAPISII